ncbi:V-type proton ATPase subunit C [Diutina catenulata]
MPIAKYAVISLPESANSQGWLSQHMKTESSSVFSIDLPQFQSGTLDSLIEESEELAKIDGQLGSAVAKVVDIFTSVLETENVNRVVQSRPVTDYIERFTWNTSKFRLDKPIVELEKLITSEALGLDADVRAAYQSYQTAKTNFAAADRKRNGDLSIRSLHDIVHPEQFVLNSEHLKTLLVAVPKQADKEFKSSYETVSEYVVPRSAELVSADSEYNLYAVTLFKKYEPQFVSAAREKKWHPRTDFEYSDEVLNDLRKEFDLTKQTESKAKNDLIRLARTAYSDIFAAWCHIKAMRVYVESVLRYGLPPSFDYYLIKFFGASQDKHFDKAKKELVAKFGYLGGEAASKKGANLHEYANLVDADYEPFVFYDLEVV